MDTIASFLSAHPAAWLVILAIAALVVLRILAKLACLAVVIGCAIILLGFGGAVLKGLA